MSKRFYGPWQGLEDAKNWIKKGMERPHGLYHMIDLLNAKPEEKVVIGIIGINSAGALFYIFRPESWGHGYGREAVQQFLSIYFQRQPQQDHLDAWVFEGNVGSEKVLGKCGFSINMEETLRYRNEVERGQKEGTENAAEEQSTKNSTEELFQPTRHINCFRYHKLVPQPAVGE